MKKIIMAAALIAIASCAGPVKKGGGIPQTGWVDEDTYTVKAADINEGKAIKTAQHQILKDIVDVRLKNNSRYTDIVKIREEFDSPLANGIVIYRKNIPDGILIYYQIRDKGLRQKFQRR